MDGDCHVHAVLACHPEQERLIPVTGVCSFLVDRKACGCGQIEYPNDLLVRACDGVRRRALLNAGSVSVGMMHVQPFDGQGDGIAFPEKFAVVLR